MSSLMEVLPQKYAHDRPFNEPASFGIPKLFFQAKVTKFRTKVGLNMLINISSGFFIIAIKMAISFRIFQLRTWKIAVSALTSANFLDLFWSVTRTFIALRFNEPASFGIPELICQAKVTKFDTTLGLNMLINISSGFYHNRQNMEFCHFKYAHDEPFNELTSFDLPGLIFQSKVTTLA